MNMRLLMAAGLLASLSGCATYGYTEASAPGGYYSGRPSVEYNYGGSYGYGYPYGYGYGYGGSLSIGYGSLGYYGYYPYGYPYYGGYYRPRPPHNQSPGRPSGGDGPYRPPLKPRPPQTDGGGSRPSPWRDMDRLRQPRADSDVQPRVRPVPVPQVTPAPPAYRPQARPTTEARQQPSRLQSRPQPQSGKAHTRTLER